MSKYTSIHIEITALEYIVHTTVIIKRYYTVHTTVVLTSIAHMVRNADQIAYIYNKAYVNVNSFKN